MNRSCLRCKIAEKFASQVQHEGTPNIHPGLIPSPCWNIALEIFTTNSRRDTKVAQASTTCEGAVLRRVVAIQMLALLARYTASPKLITTELVVEMSTHSNLPEALLGVMDY